MKSYTLKLLFLITILESCSSWKNALIQHGNYNEAINNAITDFVYKNRNEKQDSVFSIHFMDIGDSLWGISISNEVNKIAVITKDEMHYSYKAFPTRYIKKDKRLFYWKDTTQNVTPNELLNKLYAMNRVDTVVVNKLFPERIRDEAQKAIDYYFCKCNLSRYNVIKTRIAMGWYKSPKVNCDCENSKSKKVE